MFFTLHIECDDEHWATLRAISDRELKLRPAAFDAFRNGAQAVVDARIRFFQAISESGKDMTSPGIIK